MSVFAKDRDYYRALPLLDLLDESKRGVSVEWHELAVVLTERLEGKLAYSSTHSECPVCGEDL